MKSLYHTTICVIVGSLFVTTSIAIPSPAQLLVTPANPSDLKDAVDKIRAQPVNGVYTQCTRAGEFALTFDDGPYRYHDELVATLDQAQALGTFFVNGKNWDCIYDQAESLQAASDKGHVIGSHTWTHADIARISPETLHTELNKVELALKKILGIKPKFFRPPYGSYNAAALEVLQSRGYHTVMWSMDSGDSMGQPAVYSVAQYAQQAAKYPAPGIALNHETYKTTVESVIPKAVKVLGAAGYKLVSLAQCLGIEPYEYVGGRGARDETWTC